MKAVAILDRALAGTRRGLGLLGALEALGGQGCARECWLLGAGELPALLPVEAVVGLEREAGTPYVPENTLATLERVCAQREPDLLLFPDDLEGGELCARLAFRLGGEALNWCTRLDLDGEAVLAQRPVYGGNLRARVRVEGLPLCVTVASGAYAPAAVSGEYTGEVVKYDEIPVDDGLTLVRTLPAGDNALESAPAVFVAGQGFGGKAELAVLWDLAEGLGLEVGGTRPPVQSGLLPLERLVGTTGVSVFPELLVAAGVSGSGPFMAGAGHAKRIIALNKDPGALIFHRADLGIVVDCKDILREMIRLTEEASRHGG